MKVLETLHKRKENTVCFDCREKGTTFVNITIGTFVCTKCAGLLRELNFAVKGLGVSVLKDKEISFIEEMGNENAKKTWLAKFDDIRGKCPNSKDLLDVQQHLNEIYIQKRYFVAEEKDNSSLNTFISYKSCDVKNTSVTSTNNNSMLDDKFDSKSANPVSNVESCVTKKPSMFKKSQSSQVVHNVGKNIPLTTSNSCDNMWNMPVQNTTSYKSTDNKAFDFSLLDNTFKASMNNTQTNTVNSSLPTHDFTKNGKVMNCVNNLYQNYNSEKKIDVLDKLFYEYNFSTGNNMRTNTRPTNTNTQNMYEQNMYNNNKLDCIYGINKQ
jgi:hypothetical protein